MPYVLLASDPEDIAVGGPLPLGFDVLPWERDGASGHPEAIWIVAHASDATLLGEISGRGLLYEEHGTGSWDGAQVTVSIPGNELVALRVQMAAMAAGLPAVAPAIRPGLQSILTQMLALLPTDPRA